MEEKVRSYEISRFEGEWQIFRSYKAYHSKVKVEVLLHRAELHHFWEEGTDYEFLSESFTEFRKLNLNGFIKIYDIFVEGLFIYVVTEYPYTSTLHEYLSPATRVFTVRKGFDYSRQILESLSELHFLGYYHGYLTTRSILFAPGKRMMITGHWLNFLNTLSNIEVFNMNDAQITKMARQDIASAAVVINKILTDEDVPVQIFGNPDNYSIPKRLGLALQKALTKPEPVYSSINDFLSEFDRFDKTKTYDPGRVTTEYEKGIEESIHVAEESTKNRVVSSAVFQSDERLRNTHELNLMAHQMEIKKRFSIIKVLLILFMVVAFVVIAILGVREFNK